MNARIYHLPQSGPACPEYFAPSMAVPVGGAIADARTNLEQLFEDMQTGMLYANTKHLPILTIAADRNGAYLVVAPTRDIYKLFGNECATWRRQVEGQMTVEHWFGMVGHIRFFWREVKCNAS